ncbi:MAG: hypothetical protein HZB53_10045 [Chloroflexi bacterium]|nr:hypothetical protein [Chloroflexota bacterium]
MSDVLPVFIIASLAILALLVGLWAAWRLFFKGGALRDAVELETEPVAFTASGAPAATAPFVAAAPPGELLRIERDGADGQLIVWISGRRVDRVSEIGDEPLRNAMRVVLSALMASPPSEGKSSTPPTVSAAEAAAPGALVAESLPAPLDFDENFERPFLTRLRESMLRPRSYAAPATPRPAKDKAGRHEAPPEWMFARINDILQRMLREQPGMTDIEIAGDGPDIRLRMNGQTYTSIDAVPDERARALIRAAVAEWERT